MVAIPPFLKSLNFPLFRYGNYIRYPSLLTTASGPAYWQMRLVGSSQVHSRCSLGRSSHLRKIRSPARCTIVYICTRPVHSYLHYLTLRLFYLIVFVLSSIFFPDFFVSIPDGTRPSRLNSHGAPKVSHNPASQ
ncbi:MAG: hypothetical protein K0R22_2966 [Sporomusa sp.]|nr:hypothetical protein [Sporomusa sp.]